MNDLPEDLAHPHRDFGDRASLIANIVTGAILIVLLAGLIAFYYVSGATF